MYVLSDKIKNIKMFQRNFQMFASDKISYTSWACFRNENASAGLTETTGEGS